jgi:hypothetical protein
MKTQGILVAVVILVLHSTAFADESAARPSICWSDNLYGSFSKAVAANKPLVVLFTEDDLPYSEQLVHEVIETETLNAFADGAIYVRAKGHNEDSHGNYAKLRKELSVERVPVLIMLEATNDHLKETGRIEGYFPADEYSLKVRHLFEDWNLLELKGLYFPTMETASADQR